MSTTDTPTTTTTEKEEPRDQADLREVARLMAESHMLEAFERISAIKCEKGDKLIFRFSNQVSLQKRQNLVRNFDHVLRQHGLTAFFIPADIELVGVLTPNREEAKDGEVKVEQHERPSDVGNEARGQAEVPVHSANQGDAGHSVGLGG
jgi:hypothetical protein